jgi:hypothetical protein
MLGTNYNERALFGWLAGNLGYIEPFQLLWKYSVRSTWNAGREVWDRIVWITGMVMVRVQGATVLEETKTFASKMMDALANDYARTSRECTSEEEVNGMWEGRAASLNRVVE